ncbi:Phosphoribosylglycinamide formyltransferase [Prochlorococcus sp. MIT 0702]|nr:Phosphoribosylglycinamide formyltransferase [Prochlorococcus sp. MIT 0701]KGG25898.1 Phosphoribosylglycinamide formyltransferase [Prochlorococcus sp. MIT 0702]KGG30928.1 Phosphoribosylglycinamide formyltransferase [Prochlorococcus sp. MIT 0703]
MQLVFSIVNKMNNLDEKKMNLISAATNPRQNSCYEKDEKRSLIWPPPSARPKFNPRLNLGVMASGNGSNFEALVKAIQNSELDAYISILVVNNPNCEARHRAKRLGVPCVIHDHREFISREELDEALVKTFTNHAVEGVVMAGWMRIVTPILIAAFPNRLLNIHPSLLPSFRGLDAVGQALKAKVPISGCSVHLVTPQVDDGPVLAQAAVPVLSSDDHQSLSKRIQSMEHQLLPLSVAIAGRNWRNTAQN